jgi:hypothetical protein
MVQEALPSGTVSNNWDTLTGAATAHEALDDPVASPDDGTTMIETNTQGDVCEVNIATVTDPTVGTGHIIHWRANGTGSGAPERITVDLVETSTIRASSPSTAIVDSTWTDFSYTLTVAEANSITDYTDLRIRMTATVLGGGETLQVTRCYLEVPDASTGFAHSQGYVIG